MTGSEIGRVACGARNGEGLMVSCCPESRPAPSRDVPFDKLALSYCSESDTSYLFPLILSKASRARRSLARISSALLDHLKGFGFSL